MKAAAAADDEPIDQKAVESEQAHGSKRKHSSHKEKHSNRKKHKSNKRNQDEQVSVLHITSACGSCLPVTATCL